jgi:Mg2+ and Co2+ transporter CorA
VRDRLNRVVGDALEKLEDDLLKLVENSTRTTEQQVLLEAIAHLRKHRGELAVAFDRNFLEVFDRRLDGRPPPFPVPSTAVSTDVLTLVEDNTIEEQIVVSQLARKAKDKIDPDQLLGVRTRIGHLLANEELGDDDNPISPEAIIEALKRACDQIPAEHAVKTALLNAFQPYMSAGMCTIYADVNQNLIAHRVLPVIRHQVRRAHDGGAARAAAQAMSISMRVPTVPAHGAMAAMTQGMRLSDLLAYAQRARAGHAGFGGGGGGFPGVGAAGGETMPGMAGGAGPAGAGLFPGGAAGGGVGGGTGWGGAPAMHSSQQMAVGAGLDHSQGLGGLPPSQAELSMALAQVLESTPEAREHVARMLVEPARYAFEPAMGLPASPALLASLAQMQTSPELLGDPGASAVNFLAALDLETRAQVHPLDQLTIELVTVVFDYILHDRALPDAVKAEVARLQIVAVKAAVLDRTFFARRQHPMRQFLDRIAALGTDPTNDTSASGAFVTRLHAVVEEIVSEFKDDLAIFNDAIASIEHAVSDDAAKREQALAAAAQELEQQEQAEIAHASALAEVRRRLHRRTPDFVRDFLLEWWTKVLVDAYLGGLQGDDSWTHRLGVADALVWSVGSLRRNEVGQLAAMLPTLMKSLARGMTAAQMPDESRQAFFNQLMEAHTAIVTAAKAQPAAVVEAPLPESGPAANDHSLPPAEGEVSSSAYPDDFYMHAVKGMQRGTVVEFDEGSDTQRAKLTWISPRQTIYLFTSAAGGARSLAPEALAQALRSGAARALDESVALMDRVVAAVVSSGRPAAAAG